MVELLLLLMLVLLPLLILLLHLLALLALLLHKMEDNPCVSIAESMLAVTIKKLI